MDLKIPLAYALIGCGALGIALPALDAVTNTRPANSPAPAPGDDPALVSLAHVPASSSWDGPVTLPRERDGHFYADIEVDGLPYRMLVDTGASVVALTRDDAEAMGVQWDPADIGVVAQGAGGPVYGVRTRIDRMALGGHEASEVDAMVIPSGLGISLLGQSFLGTIGKVEIANDAMVLGE